ncbi:multiple RNA-binding domain-containing protein 1, partial [Trichonephila clavata]
YCFIRFASEKKADSNYKALQGKKLKGQLLNVDYMGEKSKNIKGKETKGEISLNSLYIGNLPTDVTSDDLKALSTDIESVCMPKKFTDSHNLYAFMTFASKENAYANYKALQGKKFRGRVLKIEFAREKSLKNAQNDFKGKQNQHKRKFEHQEYDPAKKGKFTEKNSRIVELKLVFYSHQCILKSGETHNLLDGDIFPFVVVIKSSYLTRTIGSGFVSYIVTIITLTFGMNFVL